MFRKILFQTHWLIGITLGLVLAMSGVTGGLMAFDREISNFFLGYYQELPSARQLSTTELAARIQANNPQRILLVLTPAADVLHAAQVEFADEGAAKRGGQAPNSDDDRRNKRLVDPATGALLPESATSRKVQVFMAWLRQIHQGHWLAQGQPLGSVIYSSVGIAAVFLFLMALSGLYLRWPKGKALRTWSGWFKIHTRLKGRAFLWNLHSVLGTVVLLAYLVSAHSGAFQNSTVAWYGNAVRSLVGAPQATPPDGMGAGPARSSLEGSSEGPSNGMSGGPPPAAINAVPLDVSKLWVAFTTEVPEFRTASIQITRAPDQAARFIYLPANTNADAAGQVDVDVLNNKVSHTWPDQVAALTFAEWVVQKNQAIHEGRILGKPGVLIMMLASLAMPVFFVTGWMMYLKRRSQKNRAAPAQS